MAVFGGYENETDADRNAATATSGKKKQQPSVSCSPCLIEASSR